MQDHLVRPWRSATPSPREDELAWKMAAVAADHTALEPAVIAMIQNRIIDNAAVAMASATRPTVMTARAQALAHPRDAGAVLFGLPDTVRVHAEWAAWANGIAVRELDYHDTFLMAEYAHPGDSIPPILAVAQQCGRSGGDILRGVAAAYEIHIALVKSISLHAHKIDHIAHTGPAMVAGIGAMLGLDAATIYQAINHALHVCCTTRQSRKGRISSWKAAAPAHAGKLAIEAVDRAMRGESNPAPIYEGEDGVIAWLLDGPEAEYTVSLPEPGEAKRAILDSYPKAHSAEYQAQSMIDLAFKMRDRISDSREIESILIHTSYHTHAVIGSGANDPEKYDPDASRETLDHSLPYIFAVALEDGVWSHDRSYSAERAHRPETVALWGKVKTAYDDEWERRYHSMDLTEKAFGGRVDITLSDGTVVRDELAMPNAHPLGANPYQRKDYVHKFQTLAAPIMSEAARARFLASVDAMTEQGPSSLNPVVDLTNLSEKTGEAGGIF
ncbi:MAG: MmgE/PrpD family protein [Alphaproteobacteria bacterium]|nr:MmgE/PrpD family protein [Alphaproteobacteria bacterium]